MARSTRKILADTQQVNRELSGQVRALEIDLAASAKGLIEMRAYAQHRPECRLGDTAGAFLGLSTEMRNTLCNCGFISMLTRLGFKPGAPPPKVTG